MKSAIEKSFSSKLLNVFGILSSEPVLNFIKNNQIEISTCSGKNLFKVNSENTIVPGISIHKNFFGKPSPLKDDFVSDNQIHRFISVLSKKESILKLNHVGFCYLVDSIKEETERIREMTKQGYWNLYEEGSNDISTWLYAGDATRWQDPLIEFVLVERIDDKWVNYWLPHFQIDIDSNLIVDDIESFILEIFHGKIKPYRAVVVNNYVCVVRARLGMVNGININLDVGTEGRMPRYHREKLLKRII